MNEFYHIIRTGVDGADAEDDILISHSAFEKLCALKEREGQNNSFIRLGVKGNACQGMSFILGFDSKVNNSDKSFMINKEKIVIDVKSIFYLMGVRLELNVNGEFQFIMPFNMRALECPL